MLVCFIYFHAATPQKSGLQRALNRHKNVVPFPLLFVYMIVCLTFVLLQSAMQNIAIGKSFCACTEQKNKQTKTKRTEVRSHTFPSVCCDIFPFNSYSSTVVSSISVQVKEILDKFISMGIHHVRKWKRREIWLQFHANCLVLRMNFFAHFQCG